MPTPSARSPAAPSPGGKQSTNMVLRFVELPQEVEDALTTIESHNKTVASLPPQLVAVGAEYVDPNAATTHGITNPAPIDETLPGPSVSIDQKIIAKALEEDVSDAVADAVPELVGWMQTMDDVIKESEATKDDIMHLKTRIGKVTDATTAVHEASEFLSTSASQLMVKKAGLERYCTAIRNSVEHFERVDAISREVSHPLFSASAARFPALLAEIEETMGYLNVNRHYSSARAYASRLVVAHQRALVCLRDSLLATINTSATRVTEEEKYVTMLRLLAPAASPVTAKNPAGGATAARAPDDSTVVWELTSALPVLNNSFVTNLTEHAGQQIRLLQARCSSTTDAEGAERSTQLQLVSDAQGHLEDVLGGYKAARVTVLHTLLRHALNAAFANSKSAVKEDTTDADSDAIAGAALRGFVATAATILLEVVREECRCFGSCWELTLPSEALERPDAYTDGSLDPTVESSSIGCLRQLTQELCTRATEIFRSELYAIDDVQELALLVQGVNDTVLRGMIKAAGDAGALVGPIFRRMLQDGQERLIFRTSVYIRSVIVSAPSVKSFLPKEIAPQTDDAESKKDAELADAETYTPVERTLFLLNVLNGAVDESVFSVFADEAVALAIQSLAKGITAYCGRLQTGASTPSNARTPTSPNVPSSEKQLSAKSLPRERLLGHLYFVLNLAMLREQLRSFNLPNGGAHQLEKSVDFYGFLQAVVTERRLGELKVVQTSKDALKEVEHELRGHLLVLIDACVADFTSIVEKTFLEGDGVATACKDAIIGKHNELTRIINAFVTSVGTRQAILRPAADATVQLLVSKKAVAGCTEEEAALVRDTVVRELEAFGQLLSKKTIN